MAGERELTVAEAIILFEVQLAADGRSIHTKRQYLRHLRSFEQFLLQRREVVWIDRLTHSDVAAFFASPAGHQTKDGRSKKATSVNALRSSIRTFGRFVHDAGWTTRNPAALLRRALCGSPPPRAIAPDDVERLLTTIGGDPTPAAVRDRMLVSLLLKTGLRLNEALGLDVADVDLHRHDLLLRTTKGNRPATVPIAPDVGGKLASWIGERASGPLFLGHGGRRLTPRHAQRRFKAWATSAGLPAGASPHCCRHSFAQQMYERTGGDLGVVQLALRHRSLATTQRYAHASDARLRQALQA